MAGVKRIGQYVLGETIGTGSFGKVQRAQHAITGHVVAVKVLNREKVKNLDMMQKIKREVQILKMFRHPHIIKLYQVISSPTDIFMVMEFVSGGELFDYILKHGKLSESESRKFFQQIISGVDYLHRHMVVHRDLKPENLLLDDKQNVKIADFGLSNIMTDGDFLKTSCGSPNYAAPEVISGHLYAGPEVDVWSCGVILYVLLCGKLPFDDDYVPSLFKKIKGGVFTVPPYLSPGAKDLVCQMLRVDPLKRITIAEIRQHEWFKKDLPPYLFVEAKDTTAGYDESIIKEICQTFQVYREHVVDALLSKDPKNQIAVAYHIIQENNHRLGADHASSMKSEEQELAKGTFLLDTQLASGASTAASSVSTSASGGSSRASQLGGSSGTEIKIPTPAPKEKPGTRMVKRSRWHLGMRSQNRPEEVMAEVFRAMQTLNFQWKVITPYHARCRCWNQVSGTMMKMSLQLYKTDDQNYLLDFKNLATRKSDRLKTVDAGGDEGEDEDENEGIHTLEFFELCAMLITELGR